MGTYFDVFVAIAIFLQMVVIGAAVDYQASHPDEPLHLAIRSLQVTLCVTFTIELLMRMAVAKPEFFTAGPVGWNVFDTVCVVLQIFEEVASLALVVGRLGSKPRA